MPDELLPATFALPEGDDPPFTDALFDSIETGEAVALARQTVAPIADLPGAEYTMARLARVDRDLSDLTAQRAAWMGRIDEWYDDATRGLTSRRAFLEDLLESWAIAQRRENPRGPATLRVPSGEVATRQAKEPAVVLASATIYPEAEERVLAWAADALPGDAYDDVVNTTTKLRISELRKFVRIVELERADDDDMSDPRYVVVYQSDPDDDTTRELVPGLVVEPPSTTAKVRPLV